MSNFSTKIFGLAGAAVVFAGMAFGQQATCAAPTATTNIIRAEGTAELVATVNFVCTSAAGQLPGIGINAQVFLSPALPVTSRVLSGVSTTEAILTITSSAGGTSTIQGSVSGSTINFSGLTPNVPVPPAVVGPSIPAGGTLTFSIANVRVNATSLSVTTGVPPSISETVFVSGPSVVPAALASSAVAFAQNGLGALRTWRGYTVGTPIALGVSPAIVGLGNVTVNTTAGANNFVICNPYRPSSPAITAISANNNSLASVVEVNENFAGAFRSLATETAANVATTPAAAAVISTRVRLNFANVPSNVTILLPTEQIASTMGGGVARLQWVTSDTGTTSASATTTNVPGGLPLGAVALTAGAGTATFQVAADDLTNLDRFEIPVYVSTSANAVPGSATAMTVNASFAPVGSTSVPNFVVGASTANVTLSTFNLCTTSLLFPFVTNQLGFDTGIAISNTSTDPFGAVGAAAQAGTCTLNFYGAGAPSPSNVTSPNVPSGTTFTLVLSTVAPGFQGYMIAQCAFQFAHGFGFITNGVGPTGGLSQGYLAGVIPDVNQIGRGANPTAVAPLGSGETLAN